MRTYGRDTVVRARSILIVLIATLLCATALSSADASHAAGSSKPGVSVSLASLDPTYLVAGKAVTLAGTITNTSDHAWTDLQAYLVIPKTPFTTRKQIDDLLDGDSNAYAGERVVGDKEFATLGDLAVNESKSFSLTVPYGSLGISGTDGVYPIGAQVLGTDDKGARSAQAIGRAYTFIPKLAQPDKTHITSSIIWPFLSPVYRLPNGTYADTERLLTSVSPGGRMRRVLDIARSSSSSAVTVLIDPSLLTALQDIATDQYGPPSARKPAAKDVPADQRAAAQAFLNDLLTFARSTSTWVLGYSRPDVQALAASGARGAGLRKAVDTATTKTLASFGISGRRVSWPVGGALASSSLRYVSKDGDQPVIVSPSSAPKWQRRDGSLLSTGSGTGPTPILVDDPLIMRAGSGNTDSALTVRQRLVSESALAVLQRSIDPASAADATLVIDPTWNPPADWTAADFYSAFNVPWLTPTNIESRLTTTVPKLDGSLSIPAKGSPNLLSYTQISAAKVLRQQGSAISSIAGDGDSVYFRQLDAQSVSSRWASSRVEGATNTEALTRTIRRSLKKVTIAGPDSVTLSSKSGRFPLTITNGLSTDITVGIRLKASDSTLRLPDVKAVKIGPNQRSTITVKVDVGDVRRANVTASLLAPNGTEFGDPASFILRTSALGMVIWIGMGVAALLVAAAIIRRFVRKRRLSGDDD